MITRVRFEASAKTEQGVQDDLATAIFAFRDTHGGEWEYETNDGLVQTTKTGYWQAVALRRKGETESQAGT